MTVTLSAALSTWINDAAKWMEVSPDEMTSLMLALVCRGYAPMGTALRDDLLRAFRLDTGRMQLFSGLERLT